MTSHFSAATAALFASTIFVQSVAVTPAHAADAVEDFYKGKTVIIIVGTSPGGGYDTYARLLQRHFSKHIPGNP
ncbi:MAG: hypothetical protein NWT00_11460, partial [Beijerinckiaceae bacterium]|nr:hypothetical protein [Beijerinckiaceae bacterium]